MEFHHVRSQYGREGFTTALMFSGREFPERTAGQGTENLTLRGSGRVRVYFPRCPRGGKGSLPQPPKAWRGAALWLPAPSERVARKPGKQSPYNRTSRLSPSQGLKDRHDRPWIVANH